MFCRLRFKCCFLTEFLRFWMPFGSPFCTIFQKKTVPEIALKKGSPQHENDTLWTRPEAPREAASRAHFSNKKKQFELEMLFEFVSIAFFPQKIGNVVWVRLNCNCSNFVFEKMERVDVESTSFVIWHALAKAWRINSYNWSMLN